MKRGKWTSTSFSDVANKVLLMNMQNQSSRTKCKDFLGILGSSRPMVMHSSI